MSILVAEDDKLTRRLLGDLLRHFGYDVECVDDGEQAVATMGRQPFQLVMMDVVMPVMNGIDAVRLLRNTFVNVPVIMVTAYKKSSIAGACFDEGKRPEDLDASNDD